MKFLRFLDSVVLWFTPQKRRYIYRITNAAVLAAVIYGFVAEDKIAALGLIVNAVLGMADAKVDTHVELPSEESPVEWEENHDRLV